MARSLRPGRLEANGPMGHGTCELTPLSPPMTYLNARARERDLPTGEHGHDNSSEHIRGAEWPHHFPDQRRGTNARTGEQFTVPPGAWHRWWNAGQGEVRTRVRFEPALRFEEAILVLWGLCVDGHTNAKGGALAPARRCWPPVTETKCVCATHPRSRSESCCPRWPSWLGCSARSGRSSAT